MSEIVKASRFKLMEAADNAQIVAEINGEMVKAMVYTVKGKDRLSYAGAKFAAIQLGNIHVKESSVVYNKDLDWFEASALALNENINLTLPGFAEQPRLMKVWDNKERTESHLEVDEFARRKAGGKAVRNALMAVMPAGHIAAYMKAMLDQGSSKNLGTNYAPKQVDSVVISRYDVAAVKEWLYEKGIPHDLIKVERDGDMVVVRNTNNESYSSMNEMLRDQGFQWVGGGKRWEREI